MFEQEYRERFSFGYSQLIDAWFDLPPILDKIFAGIHKTPQVLMGKTNQQIEDELNRMDNLIVHAQPCFKYDCNGFFSFTLNVQVNASFMPDEVDKVCEDYFDMLFNNILKHFVDFNGEPLSDSDAEDIADKLKNRKYWWMQPEGELT